MCLRVMARLREDGEDILKQSVKNRVEAELTEIMPAEDPGAFESGDDGSRRNGLSAERRTKM